MKTTLITFTSTFALAILLTGCGQKVPYINDNVEEECATISKNLVKIDEFTKVVNKQSAFHLEEAAVAYEMPKITKSNNKRQMLKDAAKKKAKLEAEQTKLGCEK